MQLMSTTDFNSIVSEFFNDQQWACASTLIKSTSVYDPNTSENVVTEKRYAMKAIVLDYINRLEGIAQQSNTLIRTGDKQVFLYPSQYVKDIDPTSDKLQIGNKVYDIVVVKEMHPNLSNTLYWELYVRI